MKNSALVLFALAAACAVGGIRSVVVAVAERGLHDTAYLFGYAVGTFLLAIAFLIGGLIAWKKAGAAAANVMAPLRPTPTDGPPRGVSPFAGPGAPPTAPLPAEVIPHGFRRAGDPDEPVVAEAVARVEANAGDGDRTTGARRRADGAPAGLWRDDPYLIARSQVADFPNVCVHCGAPAGGGKLPCTVRPRPGVIQFLIPLTGVFSASVSLQPAFCERHWQNERAWRFAGHVVLALALMATVLPVSVLSVSREAAVILVPFTLFGLLLGNIWVYYRIFRPRPLYARRIKKDFAWLDNVHRSLLDGLPEAVSDV